MQLMHGHICIKNLHLQFAIAKSNLPSSCTDVSVLSVDLPFRRYL